MALISAVIPDYIIIEVLKIFAGGKGGRNRLTNSIIDCTQINVEVFFMISAICVQKSSKLAYWLSMHSPGVLMLSRYLLSVEQGYGVGDRQREEQFPKHSRIV
jgi:hypothetical protein